MQWGHRIGRCGLLVSRRRGGAHRAKPSSKSRLVSLIGTSAGGYSVVRTAAALCSTTVVTATLGFLFWAVAARVASAEVVGRSAAVVSAIEFIATLATLGLHTLLIAELPRRAGPHVRRLATTAFGIAAFAGLSAALGFAIVHRAIDETESMYATPASIALFGFATATSAVVIVVDGALIGLGLSRLQVARNFVFAATKLALLPVAAGALGVSPQLVITVWLLGNLVSLVLLAGRSRTFTTWLRVAPSLREFAPLWRITAGHHWVNVATQAPRLLLPIMVASQLGDEANAAFYAALLLITFIWMIPNHLGVAMFALNSGDSGVLRSGLDAAVKLSALVSLAAALCGPLLAYPLLSIFGESYVDARYCFMALVICTFAGATKAIYIAVKRSQGQLATAARAAILGAVLELSAAEAGLLLGGITGIGIGLGAATVIEAAFYWPTIARARHANMTVSVPSEVQLQVTAEACELPSASTPLTGVERRSN